MRKLLYLVFITLVSVQCTEDDFDEIKNSDKRLIETVWQTKDINNHIEGDGEVVFNFNSITSGVVYTTIGSNEERMTFKYIIGYPELVITYSNCKTAHFRFKNDNTLVIVENNRDGDFVLYNVTE